MPPICWGAADTEGSGSGGALPPGRGVGRGAEGGGLVSGRGAQQRKSCVGDGKEKKQKTESDLRKEKKKDQDGGWKWSMAEGEERDIEDRKRNGTEKSG